MKRLAFVTPLLLLGGLAGGVATAEAGNTVSTRGDEVLKPNSFVRTNLRFSPGGVNVQSGETVTWTNADKTEAPHTVTIATANQLVQNFSDFLLGTCPDCDAAIGAALAGHFPPGPPVPVIDDGDGAFEDPGDSMLFFPGQSVSAEMTAPSGSTLFYFCAIHAWMQGTIKVR